MPSSNIYFFNFWDAALSASRVGQGGSEHPPLPGSWHGDKVRDDISCTPTWDMTWVDRTGSMSMELY